MKKVQSEQGQIPAYEPGIELLAFLRPYVRHCGDARRPAWSIKNRKLLDYLLVHIDEGFGHFIIDGKSYEVKPGDLFWIPPDTEHGMEGYPPGMVCPYVHFDLVYRPQLSHWDFSIPGGMTDLADLAPLMHEPISHPLLVSLKGRIRSYTNVRVSELLHEICLEAARAHPFAALRSSGLLLEIIAEILRGKSRTHEKYAARMGLLEQTANWIIKNCHKQPGLKEMAAQCRLSPSHFRQVFGDVFGCSPRAYLRRARIRAARSLMMSSGLSLSEIACQVGFETVHSFSKAFRQMEGMPPSTYRQCGSNLIRVEGRKPHYLH